VTRSRVRLLALAMAGSAVAASVILVARSSAPARPNIVLILIDTLRADHLGAYGYDRATSPNIDALARRGVLFETAASQSTWTFGSVPSLLTSRYAQALNTATHHVRVAPITPFPPGLKTFPERLRAAGYGTAVVSNHAGLPRITGLDAGFDRTAWLHQVDDSHVASAALEQLADLPSPFFLWVYFLGVHAPYVSPEPYRGRFQGDGKYTTGRILGQAAEVGVAGTIPKYAQLDERRDADYYVAAYDAKIAWLDQLVADVLAELQRRGLDRNTVVVLCSDHGELLGEDEHYYNHGSILAWGGVHVPLLVALPDDAHAGARVTGAVGLIDLAPTLVDLAGAEPDPRASGRSLVPCFADPERCDDGHAFTWASQARQTGVTDGHWFLRCGPGASCALFELDAAHQAALSAGDRTKEIRARLRQEHDQWLQRHPAAPARPQTLDPDTRGILRDLGYVAD